MTRLIVVVEGQTEEAFLREVLIPHLAARSVWASVTIVGKAVAQRRGHQGRGGGHFRHWLEDIRRILGSDRGPDLRVTTLFDLYGLPEDFPGLIAAQAEPDTQLRCELLQRALGQEVEDHRLIPYLQRHEFEALVLASLPVLRDVLETEEDLAGLEALMREIRDVSPEDVNDGPESAPSKRLLRCIPGYRKTLHGPLAAEATGLALIRRACPRFDAWVARLEGSSFP